MGVFCLPPPLINTFIPYLPLIPWWDSMANPFPPFIVKSNLRMFHKGTFINYVRGKDFVLALRQRIRTLTKRRYGTEKV